VSPQKGRCGIISTENNNIKGETAEKTTFYPPQNERKAKRPLFFLLFPIAAGSRKKRNIKTVKPENNNVTR
jgi:hypothetical protein